MSPGFTACWGPGSGSSPGFMTAKRKDDLGPRGILTRPVKKTVHPFGDSGNQNAR